MASTRAGASSWCSANPSSKSQRSLGSAQSKLLACTATENSDCVVNVDVAPSQAVQVAYFYNGQTVPMTHEIACQKARNAAELAMQTILAQAG